MYLFIDSGLGEGDEGEALYRFGYLRQDVEIKTPVHLVELVTVIDENDTDAESDMIHACNLKPFLIASDHTTPSLIAHGATPAPPAA